MAEVFDCFDKIVVTGNVRHFIFVIAIAKIVRVIIKSETLFDLRW